MCEYYVVIDRDEEGQYFAYVPELPGCQTCADTIDERVAEIVGEKKDLSDYVIDDVPNERFSDQLKSMVLEA